MKKLDLLKKKPEELETTLISLKKELFNLKSASYTLYLILFISSS